MRGTRRVALLLVAGVALAAAGGTGCAGSQGTSFETLGIPEPEDRPGRAPLIVGWAYEDRAGWVVRRVRVDGDTRSEWSEESEAPTIMYLRPGTHELRLYTAQLRDADDRSSRSRRRYRTRPLEIELEEGLAQLCTIRVEGDSRRRPSVRCQARELEVDDEDYEDEDEYGDEFDDDEEYDDEEYDDAAAPAPAAAPPAAAPAQGGTDEGVPDPFAAPAAAPAPPAPAPAPAPTPTVTPRPAPTPRPAVAPRPTPTPRPLSLEERVERLERQLEELRRSAGSR